MCLEPGQGGVPPAQELRRQGAREETIAKEPEDKGASARKPEEARGGGPQRPPGTEGRYVGIEPEEDGGPARRGRKGVGGAARRGALFTYIYTYMCRCIYTTTSHDNQMCCCKITCLINT